MVMRLVMVFVLMAALTGCLKKNSDENLSMEPAATEEATTVAMADVSQDPGAMYGKSVSVEPAVSQSAAVEKPSIQDIQQALKNAELYEDKIDGVSGPKTRKAIEAFQSQNGLKADGKVGPNTWQKLKRYLNKKAE
jgi:peptidoglycan hydrolase-like protein with peptidoglycan-binding domain